MNDFVFTFSVSFHVPILSILSIIFIQCRNDFIFIDIWLYSNYYNLFNLKTYTTVALIEAYMLGLHKG